MTRLRWWLRWPLLIASIVLGCIWERSGVRIQDLPGRVAVAQGRLFAFGPSDDIGLYPGDVWMGIEWPTWSRGKSWTLIVPLWFIAAPLVAATAWAWWPALPRPTPAPGLCPKCGYDRAGLDSGARCPECGAGANREA